MLDDGQLLSENVALLGRPRPPRLAPGGEMGRIRLIEMRAFIATELHKPFVCAFFPTSDAEKEAAQEIMRRRLGFIAARLKGEYLFGRACTADAYLYVMLRWARGSGLNLPRRSRPSSSGWRRARPCASRCSTKVWPEGALGLPD